MKFRPLGQTGMNLSWVSYGASSLGQEFRTVDLNEAMRSVHTALDLGMNFIDTSPFYGRGLSECLLGPTLKDIPRDHYYLGTKLGRYDGAHFDFSMSVSRNRSSVNLHRMKTDHFDIVLCHDIEFVEMSQIVQETLPALRKLEEQGKVRFIGISGYPMNIFKYVLERTELDVVLSYNHYALQNTDAGGPCAFSEIKGGGGGGGGSCRRGPVFGQAPHQYRASTVAQSHARRAPSCTPGCRSLRIEGGRYRTTRPSEFLDHR